MGKKMISMTLEEQFERYLEDSGVYELEEYLDTDFKWEYAFESDTEVDTIFRTVTAEK